jgi:polygalacturonase
MSNIERRDFLRVAGGSLLAIPAATSAVARSEAPRAHSAHTQTGKPASPRVSLSVKDLRAIGDGKADDTLALQQTIDRCSVLGGGEVLLPAGNYSAGALVLRSGVALRIAEGASLLGIADIDAYPLTQVRWEGKWIKGHSALISATDSDNIASPVREKSSAARRFAAASIAKPDYVCPR